MSFLQKFQAAGRKVGVQATAFSRDMATMAGEGSRHLSTGFTLEGECEKAAKILSSFLADPENPESALNSIPKAVLLNAQGFAIFTVLKAGFVWSAKAGSGIVISRLEDGSWSAPSCIATGGVGVGLQIGADLSEFVIVLNSPDAVKAFTKTGNLTIGGTLSAAAGPIGTGGAVNASLLHPAPMFTYSKNKGLFAGISLEGTALIERKDANEAFYGTRIACSDILTGKIPPPEAASKLYDTIEMAENVDESGIGGHSFVPQPVGVSGGSPTSAGGAGSTGAQGYSVGGGAGAGVGTGGPIGIGEHKGGTVFDAGDAH